MKTKFTPAPWAIDSSYDTMLYITANGHGVCEVDCDTVYAIPEIAPTPQQKANAHLIASAPEMYKLLQEISEDDNYELFGAKLDIENLLKKARGES